MSESNGNGLASAEDLFAPSGCKRRYKDVTLPISGLAVRIRSLSENEMGRYQSAMYRTARGGGINIISKAMDTANRRLIVLCLVDGAGNRILTDSHVKQMGDWDAADVNFLFTECSEHCGVSRDDIEDLVKNSAETSVAGPASA